MAKSGISRGKRKKRRLILFVVEIIILIAVAVCAYGYSRLNLIESVQLDKSKIDSADVSDETQAVFEGYMTIALFGLDNRTTGIYDSGHSDVIMVMNINNDTQEVSLVSIYRDTYLDVSATGEESRFRKANAAYNSGGAEQAISMLQRSLDLDIDNYIAFDFEAVAEAVDILGGVDITIDTEEELKWLNEYIVATNKILSTDADTVDGVGEHTLNGVQAVAYARIRYTSGNDFKRAKRQRLVFSQLVTKAKKANISQLNELVNEVFPLIQTDLTNAEIIRMISAMIGYDLESSIGFPFYRTTETLGSTIGSVVIPVTLEKNVIELHRQLFGTENYEPSDLVKRYSQYIINDTGYDEGGYIEDDEFIDADNFDGSNMSAEDESESAVEGDID